MSASRVMLIRHAEKSDDLARVPNLGPDGRPDEHGLSLQGWLRAGALVRHFAPHDEAHGTSRGLVRPVAIAAMSCTAARPSRRPELTVRPLAAALELPVQQLDDLAALHAWLASIAGPALVCWRHQGLPDVAQALAPRASIPELWPQDRFDVTWVVDFPGAASASAAFSQQAQRLLAGDRDEPIAETGAHAGSVCARTPP